jgi:hypothetical protein
MKADPTMAAIQATLSLIDKVGPLVQRYVAAIRALELGTDSSDTRLRGEKIVRYLFDLNSGVHEREMAIRAK